MGAALSLCVFPEAETAYVFGGYIKISSELAAEMIKLSNQGQQYQRISDHIPYTQVNISYLHIQNHVSGDEVLCEEPTWSFEAWLQIFNYYRVHKIQGEGISSRLVMSVAIGESKDSYIELKFFEKEDRQIILHIDGYYYKPVKGEIVFKDLQQYSYDDKGFINCSSLVNTCCFI